MPDLKNRELLTYDQGVRATCPACLQPIRWVAQPGQRDLRANHKECGLSFALMVHRYQALVMDENGDELDDKLQPIVNHGDASGANAPREPKPYGEELQGDGTVLIKAPGAG